MVTRRAARVQGDATTLRHGLLLAELKRRRVFQAAALYAHTVFVVDTRVRLDAARASVVPSTVEQHEIEGRALTVREAVHDALHSGAHHAAVAASAVRDLRPLIPRRRDARSGA